MNAAFEIHRHFARRRKSLQGNVLHFKNVGKDTLRFTVWIHSRRLPVSHNLEKTAEKSRYSLNAAIRLVARSSSQTTSLVLDSQKIVSEA